MADNKVEGIVRWFNASKGYGFIAAGGIDIFVHHSNIRGDGYRVLDEGDRVRFYKEESKKQPGKYEALEVERI